VPAADGQLRFTNKSVLVTGAASGIGRAVALRFVDEGANVFAFDLDTDGLEQTAKAADGGPGAINVHVGDVSRRDECGAAVAAAVATYGGIDVLVNVAGIFRASHFADTAEAEYRAVMGVNADGPFFMCQAAVPHLLERSGSIVNIASTAGMEGQAYTVSYCMSKGAVTLLTKALAMEYIKTPLRVNAVLPGGTDTPLVGSVAFPDDVDWELIARYAGVRGFNRPEEVAAAVAYLASDDASSVHGALVPVDRGSLAG
jgi:NAD(P)-dependent dehydrogenase (short-subunit alcohol dehydrogenase family)